MLILVIQTNKRFKQISVKEFAFLNWTFFGMHEISR